MRNEEKVVMSQNQTELEKVEALCFELTGRNVQEAMRGEISEAHKKELRDAYALRERLRSPERMSKARTVEQRINCLRLAEGFIEAELEQRQTGGFPEHEPYIGGAARALAAVQDVIEDLTLSLAPKDRVWKCRECGEGLKDGDSCDCQDEPVETVWEKP